MLIIILIYAKALVLSVSGVIQKKKICCDTENTSYCLKSLTLKNRKFGFIEGTLSKWCFPSFFCGALKFLFHIRGNCPYLVILLKRASMGNQ